MNDPFFSFDKVYIINLKERNDRREEIEAQLRRIGTSLDSPKITLFEAIKPNSKEGFSTIGARGCFLSHLGVLTDASRQGYQSILILEDDVDFIPNFTIHATGVFSELQTKKWSLFYGGYRLFGGLGMDTSEILFDTPPDISIELAHFVAFNGQAISETVTYLEAMLRRSPGSPDGGPMHVDGAYNWFRVSHPNRYTFISTMQLGVQRSSRTDIHELNWVDKTMGVRRVISWLRKIKNHLRFI